MGVPLGLAILLIPPRPYKGLEAITTFQRRLALRTDLKVILSEEDHIPDLHPPNLDLLFRRRFPNTGDWACLYVPQFGRIATGENRKVPLVWNLALSGNSLRNDNSSPDPVWLVKDPTRTEHEILFSINRSTGEIFYGAPEEHPASN